MASGHPPAQRPPYTTRKRRASVTGAAKGFTDGLAAAPTGGSVNVSASGGKSAGKSVESAPNLPADHTYTVGG